MKFMRKGQAALEFMMTYGWAILVVLAAIGALSYFGILNPSKFTPDTCMGSSGISCQGKPIVSNTSVWFTMVNGLGYKLTPTAVLMSPTLDITGNCDDPVFCPIGNVTCDSSNDLTSIQDGEAATVVIANCDFSSLNVVKGEITIKYTHPQSRLTESAVISVVGQIKEN